MELVGTSGTTKMIALNTAVSLDKKGDLFEKGKTDIFEIEAVNIGKVKAKN